MIDGFGKPNEFLNENDLIAGGSGNDLLFAHDGEGNDFVDGGGGDDKAVTDDSPEPGRDAPDVFTRTERVTYTAPAGGLLIGKLKLAEHTLTAGAEKTGVVSMSWTHPTAWQRLRTVTVKAYDGAAPVGTITLDPRSANVTASGSLELVKRKTSLATKGKAVTAQLAIRTKPSLAGKTLRLDVEATDRNGAKQLESEAGIVIVKKNR